MIKVQTIKTKPKQQLSLTSITTLSDLKSIKSQDPFMYYSIPGVRSAKVIFKDDMDIDTRTLHMSSIRQQEEGTRRRSAPDRIESTVYGWEDDDEDGISQEEQPQAQDEEEESELLEQKVTRNTRVSFECHPGLLLDDLFNEMGGDNGDDIMLDGSDDDYELGEDPLLSLLLGRE